MSYEWRVYYTDGSTFDDSDGTPYQAPDREVQFIVQKIEENAQYMILSGADYYIYEPSFGWWYTNEDGKQTHLDRDIEHCVKHGAMMDGKKFSALANRVHAELPGKKNHWRHWKYQRNPGYAEIYGE